MKSGFQPVLFLLVASVILSAQPAAAQPTRKTVNTALEKAVRFFRDQVSAEGGYLWQYSSDLKLREGEGKATETQVWVQTPGTPRVGQAYLDAYRRTGEEYLLQAACDAANALVLGQLESGGWDYRIEFDPARRAQYAYRTDGGDSKGRNVTTLDDDNTQSALRFLMQMDVELKFQNESIHGAIEFALEHLLAAQYPNGAWPQRFSEPPNPAEFPVRPASYPETWSRTHIRPRYTSYYTFNDNTIADTIRTMLEAAVVYGDTRFQKAAEQAGKFILLAQMPDPQPAWAQQYNVEMHPAWARKFEPPAVTGGESQGVMRILMDLYQVTGNKEFLEPIPRALKYLNESRLPGGRLARFYELKTNRPLYFTKQYELTYSSDDMPTHYAFIVSSGLGSIEGRYKRLVSETWEKPQPRAISTRPLRSSSRIAKVTTAIDSMDSRGAWVVAGELRSQEGPADGRIIQCTTFVENVKLLSEYMGKE